VFATADIIGRGSVYDKFEGALAAVAAGISSINVDLITSQPIDVQINSVTMDRYIGQYVLDWNGFDISPYGHSTITMEVDHINTSMTPNDEQLLCCTAVAVASSFFRKSGNHINCWSKLHGERLNNTGWCNQTFPIKTADTIVALVMKFLHGKHDTKAMVEKVRKQIKHDH